MASIVLPTTFVPIDERASTDDQQWRAAGIARNMLPLAGRAEAGKHAEGRSGSKQPPVQLDAGVVCCGAVPVRTCDLRGW